MKPPVCVLCGKEFFKEIDKGGLVSFALSSSDEEFNKRFEDPGMLGHPKGVEWFCPKHYSKARKLEHLTWEEARKKLKRSFWNRIGL